MNLRPLLLLACPLYLLPVSTASAEPYDALWLTRIVLGDCQQEGTPEDPVYNCWYGPIQEMVNDHDAAEDGEAFSAVSELESANQSAVSVGFSGAGSAPAVSAYAYSGEGYWLDTTSFGMQRYTFLEDGTLEISATLTYSFSGLAEENSNLYPKGFLGGGITTFQMDDNQFDPDDCNLFALAAESDISHMNALHSLVYCLIFNGEERFGTVVDFAGLEAFQNHEFLPPTTPVVDAEEVIDFTIDGSAGDVWFLTTDLFLFAHNTGWADSRTTLRVELHNPDLVEAAFPSETFTAAPSPAELALPGLCPCDHASDGEAWKNHGKYVNCVVRFSEIFVDAGMITRPEKGAMVSAAGRSSCGH